MFEIKKQKIEGYDQNEKWAKSTHVFIRGYPIFLNQTVYFSKPSIIPKNFKFSKKFKSASYQISAFIMSATPHNGHLEIPYYLKVFIGGNFKTTAVKYY